MHKHRKLSLGICLIIIGRWLFVLFFCAPKPVGHYDVYMDGRYYVYTYVSDYGGGGEGLALEEISYEEAHAPGREARFLSSSALWKPVTELGFMLLIFGFLAMASGIPLTYEGYKAE